MSRHQASSLPALMYHYISRFRAKLVFSPDELEDFCRLAAEQGWFGVGLDEAEAFLLHGTPLPPKAFLLTFDDGYLDNYVYAWPILQKYGHKGVIFAVTDMIDEATREHGETPRPTLADVWSGSLIADALASVDSPMDVSGIFPQRRDKFFTWPEARAMEASGVIAVAGHSLRHEAVFTSSDFTGFIHPGPNRTGFPRCVHGALWGLPNFAREAELASRAFLPSDVLLEAVRALVPQDEAGAADFFADQSRVAQLATRVAALQGRLGRLETPEEQLERLRGVMNACQAVLHKELGHSVRSFCWPWGLRCPQAVQAGREAGFEVFYNVEPGPNRPGRAEGVRRMNPKRDPRVTLGRLKVYARPFLGELYKRIRL